MIGPARMPENLAVKIIEDVGDQKESEDERCALPQAIGRIVHTSPLSSSISRSTSPSSW